MDQRIDSIEETSCSRRPASTAFLRSPGDLRAVVVVGPEWNRARGRVEELDQLSWAFVSSTHVRIDPALDLRVPRLLAIQNVGRLGVGKT